MAREIGHLEWTVLGLSATGRVLRELGDVEEARRLHEEELATSRALGATIWIADALGELGQDLVAAGDLPGGEARLREAVTTAGEALEFAVRALIALAEVTLRRGRPAEALAAAESFTARLGAFRVHAADARRIAGEALAALGRAAEAEAALQAAKAEATRLGATPPRWRACLALARLHARAGRAAQASAEQAEARELLDAVLAALPSEDLRRSFASTELVRRAQGPPG
jgi:tetratricopeptide (TPR) repeat protein